MIILPLRTREFYLQKVSLFSWHPKVDSDHPNLICKKFVNLKFSNVFKKYFKFFFFLIIGIFYLNGYMTFLGVLNLLILLKKIKRNYF